MTHLIETLKKLDQGSVLSEKDTYHAILDIMQGGAEQAQIERFLTLLTERGESVDEITGAAKAMRKMASAIHAPANAVDCCGTGGDGVGTYNVSTAVALVCAACGVPVAKHGNRAASSKSGAADVLEALGVNLDVPTNELQLALEQFNFCFLMAPHHHQAMKHVMPARKSLGFRTIFNLLGPLANPANTQYQLIGVYDKKWLKPLAQVLNNLGTKRAWLVHGHDGLDEITICDKTDIVTLDNGVIDRFTFDPRDHGFALANEKEILGGDATENAAALNAILKGAQNAYRDIVCINAGAVMVMQGKVKDIDEGVALARAALDNSSAYEVLQNYASFIHKDK